MPQDPKDDEVVVEGASFDDDMHDSLLDHALIRTQALSRATMAILREFEEVVPAVASIEFSDIQLRDTQEVTKSWRRPSHRNWIRFNWWDERNYQTRRIDVSIRCQDFLCGLMLARRSKSKLCVTLRYLEGNPYPHPLSGYVLPIALIVAESFAHEYKIRNVYVSRPEKGLVDKYASRGYEYNATDKNRIKRKNKPRVKLMVKEIELTNLQGD